MTTASGPQANYDEDKVPAYTLPDPLVDSAGRRIERPKAWPGRRAEILDLFRQHVYGETPADGPAIRHEVVERDTEALGGLATRLQVTVHFGDGADGPSMDLLLYLPRERPTPVPVFLGLNFFGNHTIHADPGIRLSSSWMRPGGEGVVDNRATDAARGVSSSRWCVEEVVGRGYGVATVYCGDLTPDEAGRFDDGVHPLFYKPGQTQPDEHEWGAIGAWAWGLSRALDYLETVDAVDGGRVIVMGHSRLGKTALWAGAQDERFALVISNNSGCTGAALARRRFGETVERINRVFPHWFCDHYKQYNDREDDLPVDQHMLIALQAPRPVLVCSAEEDLHADPRGEFLAARHAADVYQLLGKDAITHNAMPPMNHLLDTTVGYHIRPGEHDVLLSDWNVYMRFAEKHLGQP